MGVQSQRAICMSGKLISKAAEAVILTLYSWKVIEGGGLAREPTEGTTSRRMVWT